MTRGRRVVSVIGATGLVGSEIARLLFVRKFPLHELLLFASGRSPERETNIDGRTLSIRPFRLDRLRGSKICFLAAGGEFSKRHAASIAGLGCVVIDNSSAFRMDDKVPLVVPEVNPDHLRSHAGIIANPNCSTIQMVVVLAPLHRQWGLKKVIVSTYQAVTGQGTAAAEELAVQSRALLSGVAPQAKVFPHRIAFNLIPHIDTFDSEGWTREERKMMNETRKILGAPDVDVVATAVRVPVFRGHSEAVHAEFLRPVSLGRAREILKDAPGVQVRDEPGRCEYPMPVTSEGRGETMVGRLRADPSSDRALCMWIVSDNLLKGAALNAVQIAERL